MITDNEEGLIEVIQKGKPDEARGTFGIIYDRYATQLARFLSKLGLTRDEQMDVAQEAWLRAWKKIGTYEYRGIPFISWIIVIAKNVAKERWRLRSREKPLPEGFEPRDTADWSDNPMIEVIVREESAEIRKAIEEALRKTPEDYATVFEARVKEGLSSKETGELFGWSVEKVDTTLYRAKRFLQNYIIQKYGKSQVGDWMGKANAS
jgi:RNA polymerase sigma-70 factor (ECF subfamily)